MNEDVFNTTIRKFLKKVGVNSRPFASMSYRLIHRSSTLGNSTSSGAVLIGFVKMPSP
jgi:hypothetical protein